MKTCLVLGNEWSGLNDFQAPVAVRPGTQRIWGRVGPTARLGELAKREIATSVGNKPPILQYTVSKFTH
jgi:hypothetical protein